MESEEVGEPQVNDVLMGRGKLVRRFPGTLQYMEWIRQDMHLYDLMLVGFKIQVCKRVIDKVKAVNGRFLEKIEGKWRIIDPDVVLDRTAFNFRVMIVEKANAKQQANTAPAPAPEQKKKPQTKGHGGRRNRPQPQPKDVLCGRGKDIQNHPGTQRYLRWIHDKKEEYKAVTELGGKRKFAATVVRAVYDEGGRFLLKKDDRTFRVITMKEATTRTAQLFRNMLGNLMLTPVKDPSSDTAKASFDFEQLKHYDPGPKSKNAAPAWRDKDAAWPPKREIKRRRRRQPDGSLQFPEDVQPQKTGDSTPSLGSTSNKVMPSVRRSTRTKRGRGGKRKSIGESVSSDDSSYNEEEEESFFSTVSEDDSEKPKKANGLVTATRKDDSTTSQKVQNFQTSESTIEGCGDESPSNIGKEDPESLLENEHRYPLQAYNGTIFKSREDDYHSVWEADSTDDSEDDTSDDDSSDTTTDYWSCNDDSIDNWSSATSQLSDHDSSSKRKPQEVVDGNSNDRSKGSWVLQAGKSKNSRRERKTQKRDDDTDDWASSDECQARKPERFRKNKSQQSEDDTSNGWSSSDASHARIPEHSKTEKPHEGDVDTHSDWSSPDASQTRKPEHPRRNKPHESDDDNSNDRWSSGASQTGLPVDSPRESKSQDEDTDWKTNSAEQGGGKRPRRSRRLKRNRPAHWEDRSEQEKEVKDMPIVSKTTPATCTDKTPIETEGSQPVNLEDRGEKETEDNDTPAVSKTTPAIAADKTPTETERSQPVLWEDRGEKCKEGNGTPNVSKTTPVSSTDCTPTETERNEPVHWEVPEVQEQKVNDIYTTSETTPVTHTDKTQRETQNNDTLYPKSPRNQSRGIRRSPRRPIPKRRFAVEGEPDQASKPKMTSPPVEEELRGEVLGTKSVGSGKPRCREDIGTTSRPPGDDSNAEIEPVGPFVEFNHSDELNKGTTSKAISNGIQTRSRARKRKRQRKAVAGKATKDPPPEMKTNDSPASPLEVSAHDRPSTTPPLQSFDQDGKNPMDGFVVPHENDVLVLASGQRFVHSHTGTAHFLELVEEAKMECGAAIIRRQQGGPLTLINRVVEEVYDRDGRFLEKDGGVDWLEIPREEVMDMTARMLFPHSLVDDLNLNFEDDGATTNVPLQPSGMSSKEGIKPNANDVLFGLDECDDGDMLSGTLKYFRWIETNKKTYNSGEKNVKFETLNRIITLIHASNGRFLQKTNNQWLVLPIDQVLARTAQAFSNIMIEEIHIPTDHQSAKSIDAPRRDIDMLPSSSLESFDSQNCTLNQKSATPEVTNTSLITLASNEETQCDPLGSVDPPPFHPHPTSPEIQRPHDNLKPPPPPPPAPLKVTNISLVTSTASDEETQCDPLGSVDPPPFHPHPTSLEIQRPQDNLKPPPPPPPAPLTVTNTSLVPLGSVDPPPFHPHPASLEIQKLQDNLKPPPPPSPPPCQDRNSRLIQKYSSNQVRRPTLVDKAVSPPTALLGHIPGSASETDLDLSQDESSDESDFDDACPSDPSMLGASPDPVVPLDPPTFSLKVNPGDVEGLDQVSTEQLGGAHEPRQIAPPVEDLPASPTTQLGHSALPVPLPTEDDHIGDREQRPSHESPDEDARKASPKAVPLHYPSSFPPTTLLGCIPAASFEEELYIHDDPSIQQHIEDCRQKNDDLLTHKDASPSLSRTTPLDDAHFPVALSKGHDETYEEAVEQLGPDIDEKHSIDEDDVSETESEDSLPMKRHKLGA